MKVAITVSPAPVTSATWSRAVDRDVEGADGRGSKRAMPSLPRVMSTAFTPEPAQERATRRLEPPAVVADA